MCWSGVSHLDKSLDLVGGRVVRLGGWKRRDKQPDQAGLPGEGDHGKKSFVTPSKSFVKIAITKIFCYNKMFGSINKTFGYRGKFFGCSNKK